MGDETDDTVRLRVPRGTRRPRHWLPYAGGAVLVALLSAGGTWWALQPAPPRAVSPGAIEKPAVVEVPRRPPEENALPPLANEAQILADQPSQLAVYRFAPRPQIVVFQFASLEAQALMLNRVAALIEKSEFSHASVMPRDQLDAKIIAAGGRPATFYYGHDYAAASLVRFFDLATDLDAQETELRRLVQQFGWFEPGAVGALISLVRLSAVPDLDAAARAAILRHEISHGYYFTDPAYAEFCRRFWRDALTADERTKFEEFLGREGYDTGLLDLMINESQAYLVHTPDKRFFSAAAVGIAPARIAELRNIFVVGMPPGWLRDSTMADRP